jgi:hypothetical protein
MLYAFVYLCHSLFVSEGRYSFVKLTSFHEMNENALALHLNSILYGGYSLLRACKQRGVAVNEMKFFLAIATDCHVLLIHNVHLLFRSFVCSRLQMYQYSERFRSRGLAYSC